MDVPLIIDGGLATTLEARGYALHSRLWSAGVFCDRPEAVEAVHREFLDAGADILVTASYQMSFRGFEDEGIDRAAAAEAMRRSVEVARRAGTGTARVPIVAASVGPYGASQADGSEYTGAYGVPAAVLVEFHRERLDLLATSGADLLAIETLPSAEEARVLRDLLDEREGIEAWFAFSCRDDTRIGDGTPIREMAALLDRCTRVTAIGVNCTAPRHVAGLIDAIREGTDKRVVVYPNSGERWVADAGRWAGPVDRTRFLEAAEGWADAGAWAVGGCCRVGPELIGALAARLRG